MSVRVCDCVCAEVDILRLHVNTFIRALTYVCMYANLFVTARACARLCAYLCESVYACACLWVCDKCTQ